MPSFLRTVWGLLPAIGLLVACSSDDVNAAPDMTAPLSAALEATCSATAQSVCARLAACSPLGVGYLFGDDAACQADVLGACRMRYRDRDHGANAPAACDASAVSCERMHTTLLSAFGRWPGQPLLGVCEVAAGPSGDGQPCHGDGACASGVCSDLPCGSCVARKAEGDACKRQEECPAGLGCVGSPFSETLHCRKLARLGEACSDDVRCEGDDVSMKCKGGLCVARLATEGADCKPDDLGCDLSRGLVCSTETNKCTPVTLAAPGGACRSDWLLKGGSECNGHGTCDLLSNVATCTAVGRLREPCGSGRHCATGLVCTEGTCRPPNESRCAVRAD